MTLFDLTGTTAYVTGASRGIGRAIALGYAQAGADVALVARDETTLREVASGVEAAGRRALVLPCDVTDPEAVRATVARTLAELGRIDVVVNNAGGSGFSAPFVDTRREAWPKAMRLNVESIVDVCQAVGPHLLERGSGSVINVASVAGLGASPALAAYGAAKAAVVSLTQTLAAEWGARGVRVNALCPGWTKTDLNKVMWSDEAFAREMVKNVPMARWGEAEEMVGPAVFLASSASSYVTGQALAADGGQTVF